ncbi:MAG TPA: hypothetical protein ENK23_08365 [Sorangium sp.]|nr:hypothetical protein [Sorangium sp.]
MTLPSFLPAGTDEVARWALTQGLQYAAHPDEQSLRNWEPFHTMVSPARFFNAVSQLSPPAAFTVVEPWTEEGLEAPMDRTLLGYATHPGLRGSASLQVGEHFITRVSFLSDKPPPKVTLGIAAWDAHVVTRAASPELARAVLTDALRALLQGWSFMGHLEIRAGALVVYHANTKPTVAGYQRMAHALPQLLNAALTDSH